MHSIILFDLCPNKKGFNNTIGETFKEVGKKITSGIQQLIIDRVQLFYTACFSSCLPSILFRSLSNASSIASSHFLEVE